MDIRPIAAAGYNMWYSEVEPGEIGGGGYITLEPGWQLIAVPQQYGYWDNTIHEHVNNTTTVAKFKNYILDQIVDLYGENKIEVANAYLGDNQFFYSYVPGVTPTSSQHNFQLIYDDEGYLEITGFWIKSIYGSDMTIQWGEV